MNLIIDVGNTLIKFAVFDSNMLRHKESCIVENFSQTLEVISSKYAKIEFCIVSSVGNFSEFQFAKLNDSYPVLKLSYETKVPFSNLYETPQTLGVDRIALVSAAALLYPKKNVLIIDAGTCITYDILTANNEYLGGAISPGLSIRYNGLNSFTEKLPLLEPNSPNNLVGNTSISAIHSGVVNGVLFEIDGFIESFQSHFKNLTIILTGGDAHFLRDSLKSHIFANSNFLLEGLNYILEHNKN